ncbi:HAD family hydrolase [Pseudomonas sp.]|uniref:HAD family hydrolase n=1 Tax=Pseudomonas sp. TaxID=306 RepID=UPI0028A722F2|nr:HAD family hydrolase [Pseudomonas sp.]
MPYANLLFDLDGTLTDPKLGITLSIQYALAQMGINEPDPDTLTHFIGPPLHSAFMASYGFDDAQAWQAVEHYRVRFKEKGLYENTPYPGIRETLVALKETGYSLYVVTSKPWVFANEIAYHFELTGYFKAIYGSELDGTRTDKGELIKHVLETEKLQPETCLMIGDRKHDLIGARRNGVDAAGVSYGYGGRAELEAEGPRFVFETLEALKEALV